MKWEKKRKRRERKKKILGKILWAFVSHQCCLLDSFHCSRPDNKNAVRAKTPCARLAGTLRRPPGHQSGCQGRGTGMKPGPEAPSPAHPAGMAPHDALEAECRWRKCHWSCCNICTVTARDGKKSETHSFIWCPFVAECSPTDNSQRCFTYRSGSSSFHISVGFFHQTQKTLVNTPSSAQNNGSSNTTGTLSAQLQKVFSTVEPEIKSPV